MVGRRTVERPGACSRNEESKRQEVVRIALVVQQPSVGSQSSSGKVSHKSKKYTGRGDVENVHAVLAVTGSSVNAAEEITAIRCLPSVDKVLRSAASQRLIKKRDLATARLFLVVDAHGNTRIPPIAVTSDSDALAWLGDDGGCLVVVVGGGAPPSLSDATLESMRTLYLNGRVANLDASRTARISTDDGQRFGETDDQTSMKMKPVLFWQVRDNNGYLSNWAHSPFVVDGRNFNCVEQFIMWSKAHLMGDEDQAGRIMACLDPKRQKMLGRRVQPWKESVWVRHRAKVLFTAVHAKFAQNGELEEWLLETYPRRIAEASPSDSIYGIGLAPNDLKALSVECWRGDNLLGKTLELVRDVLRGVGSANCAAQERPVVEDLEQSDQDEDDAGRDEMEAQASSEAVYRT
eukprot:TRINITY_DN5667_c0_g2_i3.p1 TRINITY_DN5667_c0_g2~~TRINITY_DN5667_c0_g2_i3.p1  ORF type:complete len:406 (+),score=64.16 TRINITY_DN5667_c0_g2_i3:184-1401(+)